MRIKYCFKALSSSQIFPTERLSVEFHCGCLNARNHTRSIHLRGHQNILKRLLIQVGAFNLSLIFRSLLGAGTPWESRNRQSSLLFALFLLLRHYSALASRAKFSFSRSRPRRSPNERYLKYKLRHSREGASATDRSLMRQNRPWILCGFASKFSLFTDWTAATAAMKHETAMD